MTVADTIHPDLDAALRRLAATLPRGLFCARIGKREQPYLEIESYGPQSSEDCGSGEMWCRSGNMYLSADGRRHHVVGRGGWRNVFLPNGRMGYTENFSPQVEPLRGACTPEQFDSIVAAVRTAMDRYRTRSANADRVARRILSLLDSQDGL